jgi:hypothetical protein
MLPTGKCPGPKRRCASIVFHNKALFHTVMFTCSTHLSDLGTGILSVETMYHRGQAIHHINEKLGDEQLMRPGSFDFDLLVTTIGLMVINEVSFEFKGNADHPRCSPFTEV